MPVLPAHLREFQSASISNLAYVIGEGLNGMTRAFLAGCAMLVKSYHFK
jgi:hypothetical protein